METLSVGTKIITKSNKSGRIIEVDASVPEQVRYRIRHVTANRELELFWIRPNAIWKVISK